MQNAGVLLFASYHILYIAPMRLVDRGLGRFCRRYSSFMLSRRADLANYRRRAGEALVLGLD